jgi:hypothetical protein
MTKIGQLDNSSGVRQYTLASGAVTRGGVYTVNGSYVVAMTSATGTGATYQAAQPGQTVWVNKVAGATAQIIAKDATVYTGAGTLANKVTANAAGSSAVPMGRAIAAASAAATEVLVELFPQRPAAVTISTGGLAAVTGTPGAATNKLAIMATVKDFRTVMTKLGMAAAAT